MSRYIDEKLVKLSLDNTDFKAKSTEAINVFGDINKASNKVADSDFSGVSKGLNGVSAAASGVDLTRLESAVGSISEKFSALGVIAISALSNITNKAVDLGGKMVKAMTVDAKLDGFNEYELKMKSIQTIMANTGGNHELKEVTSILDELNQYADKTVYNFGDMTKNIGTFTAAGVDLETSVSAIQGIANLSAMSGASATDASRAMYQLSQALATGSVKLMDWNSVAAANISGKGFQDALLRTARAQGYNVDELIEAEGSFRESLKHEWLTSSVLTETLEHYTYAIDELTEAELEQVKVKLKKQGYTQQEMDDIFKMGTLATEAATKVRTFTQLLDTTSEALGSGWSRTFELLLGDFDEATNLFTNLSDRLSVMIERSADKRNKKVEEFATLGGRDALINSLFNILDALDKVLVSVKTGFRRVFPEKSVDGLVKAAQSFEKFTEGLIMSRKEGNRVSLVFEAIASVLKIFVHIAGIAGKAIRAILPEGGDREMKDFLTPFLKWVIEFSKAVDKTEDFAQLWELVSKTASESFNNMTTAILKMQIAGKTVEEHLKIINDFFYKHISTAMNYLRPIVEDIRKSFAGFLDENTDKIQVFKDAFKTAKDSIVEFFDSFKATEDDDKNPFEKMWTSLKKLGTSIKEIFPEMKQSLKDMFPDLMEDIQEYIANFDGEDVLQVAIAGIIGVIAKNLLGIGKDVGSYTSSMDKVSKGIEKEVKSAGGILDDVRDALNSFAEGVKSKLLLAIAAAILILAVALMLLSKVDSDKVTVSLAAIALVLASLMGSMSLLSKMKFGTEFNFTKFIAVLLSILLAVSVFSSVIKDFSELEPEALINSTRAFLLVIASLVASLVVLTKQNGKIDTAATTLIAFSISVQMMAKVVQELGQMDVMDISVGLTALMIILASIVLVSQNMGALNTKGVIAFAASLVVMAGAVAILGNMDLMSLGKGLTSILVLLAGLAIFIEYVDGKKMQRMGAGITALSIGLMAMSLPVLIFAAIDTGNLVKGFIALGVILAAVAVFTNSIKNDKLLLTATSLVILAVALTAMAAPIFALGSIDFMSMIQGIAGVALLLASISGFVAITSEKSLLGVAASMLLLSFALSEMSIPIIWLANLDFTSFLQGIAGIALIFAAIAGFTMVVSDKTLFGLATSMILMAAALQLLVEPILTLAGLSFEQMIVGLTGIAGVLLFMALALNLSEGTLVAALALAVVATAILAIVPALMLLSSLDLADIGRVVLILAGAFGLLVAVALILGVGGATSLMIFAQALFVIGLAVAAAATGVLALGAALVLIASVGSAAAVVISMALEAFVKTLASLVVEIVKFVIGVVVGVAVALAEAAPVLMMAAAMLIISMLEVMVETLPKAVVVIVKLVVVLLDALGNMLQPIAMAIVQFIINLINALANTIREKAPELVDAIFNFLEALIELVLEVLLQIIDMLFGWIPGVSKALEEGAETATTFFRDAFGIDEVAEEKMEATVDAISGAAPDANKAGNETGSAIKEGAMEALLGMVGVGEEGSEDLIGPFAASKPEAKETGEDLGSSLLDGFGSNPFSEMGEEGSSSILDMFGGATKEGTSTGKDLGGSLTDGFNLNDFMGTGENSKDSLLGPFTGAEDTGEMFGSDILSGFNLNDFLGAGSDGAKEVVAGADSQKPTANKSGKDLGTEIVKGAKTVEPTARMTGNTLGKNLNNGVSQQTDAATGAGKKVAAAVVKGANESQPAAKTTGSNMGKKFTEGVDSRQTDANTSGKKVAESAKKGFDTGSSTAYKSGENFGSSIASGILAKKPSVEKASSSLATGANNAFKARAEIKSPSRVGLALGGFWGIAVAMGIEDKIDDVSNASKGLAQKAIESVKKYSQMFTDQLVDNMDAEPTITPVLDLSNVNTDNLFKDPNIPLLFNGSVHTAKANAVISTTQDRLAGNNSQIVQNDNSVHIDNKGLMDGTTFIVREEADIEKIAKALDQRTYQNLKGAGYALQRN